MAGGGYLGVDLGGDDALVSEQDLDIPDGGAVVEQLGGEAVAQEVGGGLWIDGSQIPVFLENIFDAVDGQAVSEPVDEEGSAGGGKQRADGQPVIQLGLDFRG